MLQRSTRCPYLPYLKYEVGRLGCGWCCGVHHQCGVSADFAAAASWSGAAASCTGISSSCERESGSRQGVCPFVEQARREQGVVLCLACPPITQELHKEHAGARGRASQLQRMHNPS
jgi:hypothetical protein